MSMNVNTTTAAYANYHNFLSEVQNFMIRFIIETIMPIYRKEQVNGFTM